MDRSARRTGGDQHIPRPEVWTQHDEPPWPHGSSWGLDDLLEPLLSTSAPLRPAFSGARISAVLVALLDGDDGVEVLLTRRSMELRNHRGEISFPGGRLDSGETPVETALREAHEEVGLDPSASTIVGELGHLNTIVSQSYIVPIVAVLDKRPQLVAHPPEVDRILWTPLSEFSMPGTYRFEHWGVAPDGHPLHFFELDDETVWGATARILMELLTYSSHR
ncbi:MAG: CoA pyrophosphatase [Actinobacteria bacterium]|nr:MAG: CoA pyrophosphatase [Actinomycetota bacterium]